MKYEDIAKKSADELEELVTTTRGELQSERFKDRFTRKASVIRQAKLTIARILTELNTRARQAETK
jgi:ribosomal protein L29